MRETHNTLCSGRSKPPTSTGTGGKAFVARYMRYGSEETREHVSLHAAVAFLMNGEDRGELSSRAVEDSNGNVVFDRGSLTRMFIRWDWEEVVTDWR